LRLELKNTDTGSLCPKCLMGTLWFSIIGRYRCECDNQSCNAKFKIIYKNDRYPKSTMHRSYTLEEEI